MGCDVGGSALKLVRLDGRRLTAALLLPTREDLDGKGLAEAIAGALGLLLPRPKPRPAGWKGAPSPARPLVGVALPGFLDPARAKVVRLANLPALDGTPLKRLLEARLGASVRLDTDTNSGAVAEATWGAGRGFERVLYLTLGTGLGAALVVRGEPVRASRHTVGQVAHLPLDSSGPRCYCGERGCAETLLSGRGVLWRARRHGLYQVETPLSLWEAARGARSGEGRERAAALRVWREVGEHLGKLSRLLAALFSPDIIVVGGGLAGAAALFLPAARKQLGRRWLLKLGLELELRPARLGRHAGAIGAALLALKGD